MLLEELEAENLEREEFLKDLQQEEEERRREAETSEEIREEEEIKRF